MFLLHLLLNKVVFLEEVIYSVVKKRVQIYITLKTLICLGCFRIEERYKAMNNMTQIERGKGNKYLKLPLSLFRLTYL